MAKVKLIEFAYARSGDKGDSSNVGVFVATEAQYQFLVNNLTAERVKEHFKEICFGDVVRYELPNLKALNFILHRSLGGGGSETLLTDAQGKTHGMGLLQLELDVPESLLRDTFANME